MSMVLTSEAIPSSTEVPSPQSTLSDLWTQAIEEYRNTASLSKQEEQLLQHPHSGEDFFHLTKDGWDETIINRQSRHYETIRTVVCHVLGVFDVIVPALGLAGHVSSRFLLIVLTALKALPPVGVISGALKVFLQVYLILVR